MRIDFKDKSFITFNHSTNPGKVIISVGAKGFKNHLETIVNSAEISIDELNNLVESLNIPKKDVEKQVVDV